jgi:hypothetical protein
MRACAPCSVGTRGLSIPDLFSDMRDARIQTASKPHPNFNCTSFQGKLHPIAGDPYYSCPWRRGEINTIHPPEPTMHQGRASSGGTCSSSLSRDPVYIHIRITHTHTHTHIDTHTHTHTHAHTTNSGVSYVSADGSRGSTVRYYTHMNRHINACMLGHEHTFQSMHACLRMCHVPGGSQGPLDQMPYCTLTHMVNQAPYPYYTSGPRDSFNLRVSNPNLKVMLAAHNLQCQKRPTTVSKET